MIKSTKPSPRESMPDLETIVCERRSIRGDEKQQVVREMFVVDEDAAGPTGLRKTQSPLKSNSSNEFRDGNRAAQSCPKTPMGLPGSIDCDHHFTIPIVTFAPPTSVDPP